jgi:hypothetical protein
VKIWGDTWLPFTYSHKIQAPVHILSADATVSELINTESNWWNIPLVESIFPVATVE